MAYASLRLTTSADFGFARQQARMSPGLSQHKTGCPEESIQKAPLSAGGELDSERKDTGKESDQPDNKTRAIGTWGK